MKKFITLFTTIAILLCSMLPVFAEESTTREPYMPNQGVEGEVLHIMQPEELEIQLGSDFAYHGFKLELDYGTYPETIYADEYGTLKLEIGGSDKYVIRHTGEIFNPDETTTFHILGSNGEGLEPNTDSSADNSQEDASNDLSTSNEPEETEKVESDEEKNDSGTKFPIGIVIVIVVLVFLGGGAYIIERKPKTKKKKD